MKSMLDDPTPEAGHTVVLNAASLDALRALDPAGGNGFVHRVLGTYLRSLDKHLDTIQAARGSADLVALRTVAHTLKSSSASIGAIEFSALSAQLEIQLRRLVEDAAVPAEALVGLAPDLDRYADLAARVRQAVLAELGGVAP